jgi:hypothetical protein
MRLAVCNGGRLQWWPSAMVAVCNGGRLQWWPSAMVAVRKNLDLVWVWFYKDVAPPALEEIINNCDNEFCP